MWQYLQPVKGELHESIGGVKLSAGAKASDDFRFTPSLATYIPSKDMLANAPGFRSLYAAREVHFEETYRDILDRALLAASARSLPSLCPQQ